MKKLSFIYILIIFFFSLPSLSLATMSKTTMGNENYPIILLEDLQAGSANKISPKLIDLLYQLDRTFQWNIIGYDPESDNNIGCYLTKNILQRKYAYLNQLIRNYSAKLDNYLQQVTTILNSDHVCQQRYDLEIPKIPGKKALQRLIDDREIIIDEEGISVVINNHFQELKQTLARNLPCYQAIINDNNDNDKVLSRRDEGNLRITEESWEGPAGRVNEEKKRVEKFAKIPSLENLATTTECLAIKGINFIKESDCLGKINLETAVKEKELEKITDCLISYAALRS